MKAIFTKKTLLSWLISLLLIFILFTIPIWFLTLYLYSGFENLKSTGATITNVWTNITFFSLFSNGARVSWYSLLSLSTISLFASFYFLFIFSKKGKNNFIKQANSSEYGGSKFIIDEREVISPKQLKEFNSIYTPNFTKPSWLVKTKFKNGILTNNGISVKDAVHCIVVGETGAMKSQKIMIPSIILNSRLLPENQPSIVVTDPKGELYEQTAGELQRNGYEVLKLNFRDPMDSSKYNPLTNAYNFFEKARLFEENNIKTISKNEIGELQCFLHKKANCNKCVEEIEETIYYSTLDKCFFGKINQKENYVALKKCELKNLSTQEITDIVETLYNSGKESQNKSFYDSAKSLVKSVMLVLLELKAKDPNLLTEKQYNMITILNTIANGEKLTKWFKQYGDQNPTSSAWVAASGVVNSSDNARGNYFSMAKNGLLMFEDESLRNMLCDNELDLFAFADKSKPKALFLIIPDDRTDKHPLATMFVSQLYKALTYTASTKVKEKGKDELDRDVMFMLDEFGNMPAIPNFSAMLAVSRGRRIFFMLILQAYQQLNTKYSQDDQTILSNCLLTIYLKSSVDKTLEELSKKMGTTTIIKKSLTGDKEKDKYANQNIDKKELMSAAQIKELDISNSIILYSRSYPSIVQFVPSWQIPEILNLKDEIFVIQDPKPIDFISEYWFDVTKVELEVQKSYRREIKPSNVYPDEKGFLKTQKIGRNTLETLENNQNEDFESFLPDANEKDLLKVLEHKNDEASNEETTISETLESKHVEIDDKLVEEESSKPMLNDFERELLEVEERYKELRMLGVNESNQDEFRSLLKKRKELKAKK